MLNIFLDKIMSHNSYTKQVYNRGVGPICHFYKEDIALVLSLIQSALHLLIGMQTNLEKSTPLILEVLWAMPLRVKTCHLVSMTKWLVGFGCSK